MSPQTLGTIGNQVDPWPRRHRTGMRSMRSILTQRASRAYTRIGEAAYHPQFITSPHATKVAYDLRRVPKSARRGWWRSSAIPCAWY